MRVLLVIQREGRDSLSQPWVEDAVDEYTLDAWNGAMPDVIRTKMEADPANFRTLWVRIPDDSLARLWDITEIIGEVEP